MKTIKQISDEIGVSKTAVRKKIDNLGLQTRLHKNGNQWLVDEMTENAVKSAFSKGQPETKAGTSSQTESETISALVSALQSLQQQLEVKDEQIAYLQRLLDQQQQLQMIQQKPLQLEDKQEERRGIFKWIKSRG